MEKYVINLEKFNEDKTSIHPKWLIDEKAIKERRLVWLIPMIPPNIAEIEEKNKIKKLQWRIVLIRIKGAIFCQVRRIKILDQEEPLQTIGTQKWKGALPIFIASVVHNP